MADEYKILGESLDQQKKKGYWEAAIGLQKVDNLVPSQYLIQLAQANVNGDITYQEVENLLYTHYEHESKEAKVQRIKEGDLVSTRIAKILDSPGYPLKVSSLKVIHQILFQDLYTHAGQFRTENIYKKEPILNGKTVNYTNYDGLVETLEYDFNAEREKPYSGMDIPQIIKRITGFTSSIWQVHPFMEGNTRATAVLITTYLNNIGFSVDNTMFKEHSQYFRNALVRANYADYSKGIMENHEYLFRFFQSLMTGEKVIFRNRDLILWDCFTAEEKTKLTRQFSSERKEIIEREL